MFVDNFVLNSWASNDRINWLGRFLGASVGSGKSSTWGKVSGGYKFMQTVFNTRSNMKPIRGTIQNLEKWLVDHDINIMLYTFESQLEDEMSANSSTNKRDLSRTPVRLWPQIYADFGYHMKLQSSVGENRRYFPLVAHSHSYVDDFNCHRLTQDSACWAISVVKTSCLQKGPPLSKF